MSSCLFCNDARPKQRAAEDDACWTACTYPGCKLETCGCDGTGLLKLLKQSAKKEMNIPLDEKEDDKEQKWMCPAHIVSTLRRYTLVGDPSCTPFVMVNEAAIALKVSPSELLATTHCKYTSRVDTVTLPRRQAVPQALLHGVCQTKATYTLLALLSRQEHRTTYTKCFWCAG